MNRYAAPARSRPRVFSARIPKGYAGTLQTAAHVGRLIRDGARDFYVRQKAIDILLSRGVEPKQYLGEIDALFQWVQRNVRYTKDPYRVEVLHTPRRMLELRAGDCDDMTILLGAMLEAVGHPVRLVLTGPDRRRPRLFSHIYLEANHRGEWIPCDATMPHALGWAPRAPVRKVVPIRNAPGDELGDAGTKRLGDLVGIIYRTDRLAGVPRTYVHMMRQRPQLMCDRSGTQLFVRGGRYRVTARGIEG
jgi:hypothetical protein